METKEKKPCHFEIEAWGMLLFAAIMIVVLFIVVKCIPYYWKYKADKQRVQQDTTQQHTGAPNKSK